MHSLIMNHLSTQSNWCVLFNIRLSVLPAIKSTDGAMFLQRMLRHCLRVSSKPVTTVCKLNVQAVTALSWLSQGDLMVRRPILSEMLAEWKMQVSEWMKYSNVLGPSDPSVSPYTAFQAGSCTFNVLANIVAASTAGGNTWFLSYSDSSLQQLDGWMDLKVPNSKTSRTEAKGVRWVSLEKWHSCLWA